MSLDYVKELAAKVKGVGKSRIYIDPEYYDKLSTVISREEVKKLIEDGIIKIKPKKGISKGRFRKKLKQKRKGLRKGPGSIKGNKIKIKKKEYVKRIRGLRKYLRNLYDKGLIDNKLYQKLRKYVKAGVLTSRAKIRAYIESYKSSQT
jgi:large subunit ribosomal protein L19e